MEYGGSSQANPMDVNVMLGPMGFTHVNNGLRIDLDNYRDLVC
jgi:hypothetical protein